MKNNIYLIFLVLNLDYHFLVKWTLFYKFEMRVTSLLKVIEKLLNLILCYQFTEARKACCETLGTEYVSEIRTIRV